MKQRAIVSLLLLTLLLSSCGGGGNRPASSSSGTESYTETEDTVNMKEIQHAVGTVGSINAVLDGSDISFQTEHITFTMLNELAAGVKNGAGTQLLSKSGDTEVLSQSDTAVTIENTWKQNGTKLQTELLLSDTAVTVSQSVCVSENGISGAVFSLRIPDTYHVILPIQNGVRLSREYPQVYGGRMGSRFVYGANNAIQMQMLILEGEKGGVVLYAEDVFTQFKAFDVKHSGNFFTVMVESIPQAPFTDYTSYQTIPWKIIPYEGSWTSGSALYRDYAREAFGSEEADALRPDWVDDIAVVIQADLRDTKKLDAIAARIDPSKVLLQVSNFRTNLYDVNWPDYTVASDFKQYIDYAHKLGFRVQLHVNMNGCQMELPVYQKFRQYHMVNALTGQRYNEDFTDANGNSFKFAHINPASSEWRSYIIGELVKVVEETGADSLHLDQSLLAYNDANGLIDGMTSLQGNVLYHKELLEALPEDVVLGGEGINDFNAIYATFLQSHLYGIDTVNKTIRESESAQIVPVTASVMTDVITYQHPAVPTVATGEYYLAWYLNGTAIGHIPTLYRESASSLSSDDAIMEMVLREAEWYIENQPVRVYSDWDDNTVARWQLKDGSFARAKWDAYGYVLLGNEDDEDSVITRIAYGVDRIEGEGNIDGWYLYDEEAIFGLNPDSYYVVGSGKRDPAAAHIVSMTGDVSLVSAAFGEEKITLGFETENPTLTTVELILVSPRPIAGRNVTITDLGEGRYRILAPVAGAVTLFVHSEEPITLPRPLYYVDSVALYELDRDGNAVETDADVKTAGSFAGKQGRMLSVDVPAGKGVSLDYMLHLPDREGMALILAVGTDSAISQPIPVRIQINGKTVWEGVITAPDSAAEISLSLDEYRGKTVSVAFQADGWEQDAAVRSLWVNPAVISQ